MGKGMEGVVRIHTKLPGRNKDGTGGSKADITAAFSHHTGAHSRCSIIMPSAASVIIAVI